MLGFNYKKAVQALNYFAIKEGGGINKMKALKLIWLSDRLHLLKFGRPILNDAYYALNYGPVASNTKDLAESDNTFLAEEERKYRDCFLQSKSRADYESICEPDLKVFSKTDINVMEQVYAVFGNYDAYALSNESHKYPEWKKFEASLNSKEASRYKMNYEDFFKRADVGHNLFNIDPDILSMTKEIFLENSVINSL
ncbi:MAG: SocA family protein [Bacteroidia bacterium]|nr:SocA family protein [Bacteroidia bacterium]